MSLPDVHFGDTVDKPLDWRAEEFDDDTSDDDEELPETPADVVALLGFDPLEEEG